MFGPGGRLLKFVAFFDSANKVFGALAALVALIASAVALYFVFRPNDKPRPTPPGAEVTLGRLSEVARVPLGIFFDLAGRSELRASYTPQQLRAMGIYYALPVRLDGLRGVNTQLIYSLYNVADGSAVTDWVHQGAGKVKSPRDKFSYVAKLWIPWPPQSGKYFAIVEVDSLLNESLALIRTPPFTTGRAVITAAAAHHPATAAPPRGRPTTEAATTEAATTEVATTEAATTEAATTAPSTTSPTEVTTTMVRPPAIIVG